MQVVASSESVGRGAGVTKSVNGRDYEAVLGVWVKSSGTGKSKNEVRALTDKAAGDVGTAADKATLSWVGIGKTVKRYVNLLQPDGQRTRLDPYDILAAHPDIPYGASHLRNFVAAHEVWIDFGKGKLPKLGIGFFSLVLNSRLNRDERESFLQQTVENDWTTRQLKAEIKKFLAGDVATGNATATAEPSPIAWNDLDAPLATLIAIAISLRSHRPAGTIPEATAESLRAIVAELNGILNAYDAQEARDA
jgi:hypothetical protein